MIIFPYNQWSNLKEDMMELSWALFEIDSTPVGAPVGVFEVLCEMIFIIRRCLQVITQLNQFVYFLCCIFITKIENWNNPEKAQFF